MISDILTKIRLKEKEHIRSNDKYRSFDLIKELFNRNKKGDNYIDECTYHDLNIDSLFEEIDYTSSTPGEQVLYKTLREPSFSKVELLEREENYKYFKDNESERHSLNKVFKRLDTIKHSVADLIDKPLKDSKKLKLIYNGGFLLFVFSVLMLIFIPSQIIAYLCMASMFINAYLHYSSNKEFLSQVKAALYLGRIINSCDEISTHIKDSPFDSSNELSILNKKLKYIGKKASKIYMLEGVPFFGDLLNMLFLVKERSFFKICDEVIKHSDEVMELYELVGSLDASLAVIDYRDNLKEFITPEFTNKNNYYEVLDIVHPLLESAVGNDFNSESGCIVITGSNMSGKSTFLRTVGINAVTAQTINTVQAKKYKTSFFKVISSISLQDDIHAGKSYYRSEAEAIKRVVEESTGDKTILSLVDEIFKGTNPVERISAASEILNYISEGNVFSIVTTHDINLLPLIKSYDTYYFSETIEDNKLDFDYKIKHGISPNGNATKILEIMGYPSEIVKKIYSRIDEISKDETS